MIDSSFIAAIGATATLVTAIVGAVIAAIKIQPEAAERAVDAASTSVDTMERLLKVLDARDKEKDAIIDNLRYQNKVLMLELEEMQKDRDRYRQLFEQELNRTKEMMQ